MRLSLPTLSLFFLIHKMKYWHSESYLVHASDNIKVDPESWD